MSVDNCPDCKRTYFALEVMLSSWSINWKKLFDLLKGII